MFWALNGATRTPCLASQRHSPAVSTLFPASEVVPATSRPPFTGGSRAGVGGWRSFWRRSPHDLRQPGPDCALLARFTALSWDSILLGQLRRATNPAPLCVRHVTLALHNKLSGACSSVG